MTIRDSIVLALIALELVVAGAYFGTIAIVLGYSPIGRAGAAVAAIALFVSAVYLARLIWRSDGRTSSATQFH